MTVWFEPSSRLSASQLPRTLASSLTPLQNSGLAFAVRDMKVKSATIQSFNIGSSSSGNVTFGGFGRGAGPWGVFGGMGAVHQNTTQIFRTDIQIKLDDLKGTTTFLNYNLPFAITLSIQPGETLRVYFVKGGLAKPVLGDRVVNQWSPFAAEVLETGQIVPITGLPTLEPGSTSRLTTGLLLAAFGGTLALASSGNDGRIIGAILFIAGVFCIGMYEFDRRAYLKSLDEAKTLAAAATVAK